MKCQGKIDTYEHDYINIARNTDSCKFVKSVSEIEPGLKL